MRVEASRELLAPVEDVWEFVAEPHHLRDWWPGLAAVDPDRRGTSPGARWRIVADSNPSLFRRPSSTGTLLVDAAEPRRRFAFELPDERLQADVRLQSQGNRTLVRLAVEGPFLLGSRRTLARNALKRLYDLCQTAAEL